MSTNSPSGSTARVPLRRRRHGPNRWAESDSDSDVQIVGVVRKAPPQEEEENIPITQTRVVCVCVERTPSPSSSAEPTDCPVTPPPRIHRTREPPLHRRRGASRIAADLGTILGVTFASHECEYRSSLVRSVVVSGQAFHALGRDGVVYGKTDESGATVFYRHLDDGTLVRDTFPNIRIITLSSIRIMHEASAVVEPYNPEVGRVTFYRETRSGALVEDSSLQCCDVIIADILLVPRSSQLNLDPPHDHSAP